MLISSCDPCYGSFSMSFVISPITNICIVICICVHTTSMSKPLQPITRIPKGLYRGVELQRLQCSLKRLGQAKSFSVKDGGVTPV